MDISLVLKFKMTYPDENRDAKSKSNYSGGKEEL